MMLLGGNGVQICMFQVIFTYYKVYCNIQLLLLFLLRAKVS